MIVIITMISISSVIIITIIITAIIVVLTMRSGSFLSEEEVKGLTHSLLRFFGKGRRKGASCP